MVESLLARMVDLCTEILGTALTGVYLHGSLAMGCFNLQKSDIDLIVVTETAVSDGQKRRLMDGIVALHAEAPAKGIEISFVQRGCCNPFVYPTPFELHFSPMHLAWYLRDPADYVQRMQGVDKDLAAHFTVIGHHGVVLAGAAIPEVFGPVPPQDYADSIWADVAQAETDAADNPIYVILNLCRVLAFLKEDLCLSKAGGGQWGLEHLPGDMHTPVAAALEAYQGEGAIDLREADARSFASVMLGMIRTAMAQRGLIT